MFGKKLAFTSLPSFSKVLTEDQDIDTFSLSRPKHVPLWVSPLEEHGQGEQEEHFDSGEPVLKTAHESSVIQLFYDLFFVANLTTFTAVHEVNDLDSMWPMSLVPSQSVLHVLKLLVCRDH